VAFSEDQIEIRRRDGAIATTFEVVVSPEHDAEVRRVSMTNLGLRTREIDLTSYAEIVLAPPAADAAHPAFSNLFVQTEFAAELGALLATPDTAGATALRASMLAMQRFGFSGAVPTAPLAGVAADRGALIVQARALAAEAARRLERYRDLRDLIRAMTTELTSSGELSRSRVRELNHVLRQGLHYHQLEMSPDGNQYGLARVGDRLDQARAAVAGTFAEFLAGPDVGRLRICANDGCREIFIDRSPTGRRRWCTMRTCGNRAKAARHRDRYRGTALLPQPGPVRPLPASAPAH